MRRNMPSEPESRLDVGRAGDDLSTGELREARPVRERFLAALEPVHGRLEAYAFAITDSDEDARDLVSETVLKALEGFERVRHDVAFLSYLFTIAGRLARRSRWRRRIFAILPEPERETLRAQTTSPEVAADIALLREALERLPARQREAVMLHELVGLPMAEIAAIQGGSLSAAKVRVHRGRLRLAELLGVAPEEPTEEPTEEPAEERRDDPREGPMMPATRGDATGDFGHLAFTRTGRSGR